MEEYSSFIIFFLICFTSSRGAAFNKGTCSNDALFEHGYYHVLLISADKLPGIELFHAQVGVVLFAAKQLDEGFYRTLVQLTLPGGGQNGEGYTSKGS